MSDIYRILSSVLSEDKLDPRQYTFEIYQQLESTSTFKGFICPIG